MRDAPERPVSETDGTEPMAPVRIEVWDRFVRLFHWSLVAAITIAAVTGFLADSPWIDLHLWSGVTAAALIAARIVWGLLGPTHARFGDFLAGPRTALQHLRAMLGGSAERHRGHNPLGGLMILALMLTVLAIAATGAVALGGVLKAGPLAFAVTYADGSALRQIHQLLAWALLALIALHVAGAVFESLRTRENLVRAMVDGRKEVRARDHPSTPRMARPALAVALAVALLGGAWGAVDALAARPGLGAPTEALAPAYAKACAECHIAYHPSLLPRASWAALVAGLEDHFGENATLDAVATAQLAAYLQANAAEVYDTRPANRLRMVDPRNPLAITATPFWKRRHRRIDEAVFKSPAVRGQGNCEACHADARAGRFYPGNIEFPEEVE